MSGTATNELDLIQVLKSAPPGTWLDLSGVPAAELNRAVDSMSRVAPADSDGLAGFKLSDHVTVQRSWWGVIVGVDHEGMTALTADGSAATAMLTGLGVPAIAAVIIAGVLGIWKSFDRGNGVNFYVTWTGVHWFAPR